MSINIKTQKILSPSNVKKIIELGISLKDNLDVVNQKCVEEYDETRTYAPNMLCIYNDYIWKCKFTTTGVFNENKWDKLSDDLSLIDLDTIKNMVNLTDEEITNLQSLISTEIRLDKVFSSSDVYNRILNAENECKKFTLEQLAKKAGVVYKIVDDTTGVDSTEYLYLISNGSGGYNIYAYIDSSAVKISDTNINLDGYAKLTDLDNYYDKATSDGKYATITTVDGKVDKTSILSAISSNPSNNNLLSEKAINDTLVKKTDITTTIDNNSTDEQMPSAKAIYDEFIKGRIIFRDLPQGSDILAWADSLPDENLSQVYFCRAYECVNRPPNATDGFIMARRTTNEKWIGLTWYDIRSTQTFERRKLNDVWGEWSTISPIKEGRVVNSNGGGVNYFKQIKNMVVVTCSNTTRLIYTWNVGASINEGALPKPIIKIPVSIMSSNGEFYLAELDTDGYIKVKNREIPKTETGNIYYYSFSYITDEL